MGVQSPRVSSPVELKFFLPDGNTIGSYQQKVEEASLDNTKKEEVLATHKTTPNSGRSLILFFTGTFIHLAITVLTYFYLQEEVEPPTYSRQYEVAMTFLYLLVLDAFWTIFNTNQIGLRIFHWHFQYLIFGCVCILILVPEGGFLMEHACADFDNIVINFLTAHEFQIIALGLHLFVMRIFVAKRTSGWKAHHVHYQNAVDKYSDNDPRILDVSFQRNWGYFLSSMLQMLLIYKKCFLFGLTPVIGTVAGYFCNITFKQRHTKLSHVWGCITHAGTSGACLTHLFAARPSMALQSSSFTLALYSVLAYFVFTEVYSYVYGGALRKAFSLINHRFRYFVTVGFLLFCFYCPIEYKHPILCLLGNAGASILVLYLNCDVFQSLVNQTDVNGAGLDFKNAHLGYVSFAEGRGIPPISKIFGGKLTLASLTYHRIAGGLNVLCALLHFNFSVLPYRIIMQWLLAHRVYEHIGHIMHTLGRGNQWTRVSSQDKNGLFMDSTGFLAEGFIFNHTPILVWGIIHFLHLPSQIILDRFCSLYAIKSIVNRDATYFGTVIVDVIFNTISVTYQLQLFTSMCDENDGLSMMEYQCTIFLPLIIWIVMNTDSAL